MMPALVEPARWLPTDLPSRIRWAIQRAQADIGLCEDPGRPNRGAIIDDYLRRAKVPESEIEAGRGYWCVAATGVWWQDAGLEVPSGFASCDRWMAWARGSHRWSATPALGAIVLYGRRGDAQHGGLVIGLDPICSIEGNTTIESGFDRNGIAVALKQVTAQDPVLGYVLPFPQETPV